MVANGDLNVLVVFLLLLFLLVLRGMSVLLENAFGEIRDLADKEASVTSDRGRPSDCAAAEAKHRRPRPGSSAKM
jgi:hypothetical protein